MAHISPAPRPRRRWLQAVVASVVLVAATASPAAVGSIGLSAAGAAPATAAAPSPGHESQFVTRINSLRASKGLSQLQVHSELVGVARNWTERMVADGHISHNPNLGSQVSGNWTKLGENVGVGYDVDGLMQAFINSSAHYKNLVDPEWNYVGVGVVISGDGRMWTTHNFMAKPAPPPPPPPPPPKPTPQPKQKPSASAAIPKPPAAPPPVAAPPPPPPPEPHPTATRVGAILAPLRSLERG